MVRAGFVFACVGAAAALVAAGCGSGDGPLTAAAPTAGHGTLPPTPQASRARGILTGVSCPSPVRCVAVGEYYHPGPRYALIERWDGSRWSIVRGPAPPAHTSADLSGISCTGASDCTAVGSSTRNSRQPTTLPSPARTLIEHWDGSAWSIVKSPNLPVPSNQLAAVACTSAWHCIAVGASGNPAGLRSRTLAERWDGSRWVIVRGPSPAGAIYSFLSSISCTGSSNCVAVGEYFPGGHHRQNQNHALIERWNGSAWTVVASPRPPGSIASYLSAVSCTAAPDCVAVGTARYSHRKGDSYGGPREHTLTEHWNGSAWAIVSSPNPPGPPADRLAGVACSSAADCTAVGAGGRLTRPGSADGASTLVEHWNGSAWSIVKSPSPSANSDLSQVACTTASDCTAVGSFGDLDNPESPSTLVERWNGSAWSLVTQRHPSSSG
jgi:hypothetical protein